MNGMPARRTAPWLRLLLWLSVGLILVGCASPPISSPTISPSSSQTPSPTPRPLRVAFLYFGKIADSNWTLAHERGRLALLLIPGVEADSRQNVPAGADALPVLQELATSDYDVIISTSVAFQDAIWKAAEEYPRVQFLQCDGTRTGANLSSYFGWIEEPLYLAGMVAAGTSTSGKLGFVAAFPISEVIRNINAFTLGARSVNPQITVQVAWCLSWDDRVIERQKTTELLDAGCDVIAQWQDNGEALLVAQERGAYGIGIHTEMSAIAPQAVLTSAVWDWSVYYTQAIQQIRQGDTAGTDTRQGMKKGFVGLTPLSSVVPEAVRNLVEAKASVLRSADSLTIFTGPLIDQQGAIRLAEGRKMTLAELQMMDWFVQGVLGEILSD